MDGSALEGVLAFMKGAENLKNTLRYAFTSAGRRESAAEHSWRLSLLVMVCAGDFPELHVEKMLKLAVIHDLAEAICGDIPAIYQNNHEKKASLEREALRELCRPLPERTRREILELWEEYEAASTGEAQCVKALDKLETLIQHNQGRNPPGFDYAFNLTYGADRTNGNPALAALRKMIDQETEHHIEDGGKP